MKFLNKERETVESHDTNIITAAQNKQDANVKSFFQWVFFVNGGGKFMATGIN